MRYQLVRRSTPVSTPSTVLGTVAAQLGPNQSMLVPVTITQAQIRFDGAPIIKWATNAPYNPVRRSICYFGKAQSTFQYRGIEYFLDTNTVTNPSPWDTVPVSGHGYCHNTAHHSDGRHWHRPYFDQTVWERNSAGVWTALPNSGVMEITSTLKWYPPLDMLLNIDGDRIRGWNGVSWSLLQNFGDTLNSYYYVGAYNPNGQRLIFGAGNFNSAMRKLTGASSTPSSIATPPFNPGAGEFQGCVTADPNSEDFVACRRSTNDWAIYDSASDTWSAVSQSAGSGSSPQNGAPNVVTGAGEIGASRILTTVPAEALGTAWGVVTCMEYIGSGGALLWAWRP